MGFPNDSTHVSFRSFRYCPACWTPSRHKQYRSTVLYRPPERPRFWATPHLTMRTTTLCGLSLVIGVALGCSSAHAFVVPSSCSRLFVKQAPANHAGGDFQHQHGGNDMMTATTSSAFIPSGGGSMLGASRLGSSQPSLPSRGVTGGVATTRMICSPLGLGKQN